MKSGGKLKKEFNLITLVAAMIGLNIGGSLFVLTAMSAGLTGPSLFFAQIVSGLPVLLALIPYSMLTSAIPTNCGNYQYAKLFSRPLAVASWWGLFAAIPLGALPLFALATAKLLIVLFPGLPLTGTAILVITVFFIINMIGIKTAAYIQAAGVAILIIALGVFVVKGLPAINAQNLTPLFTGGITGFIGAAALLYTLLAGGLFGIEMGDEVKNARSTIPKALIISILVVLIIYLLIEIVSVAVVNYNTLSKGGTLGTAAEAFLSDDLLAFFVVGGGILASTTTINLTMTASGRYALALSEDGLFPQFFSRISRRFGTPHWGLTLAYVLSIISLVANPSLQTLAAMLNFGLIFIVTLVLLAAFRVPKTHPEIFQKARYKFNKITISIASLTAVAINMVLGVILAVAVPNAFLIFMGFVIFGVAFYFVRKRMGVTPSLVSSKE